MSIKLDRFSYFVLLNECHFELRTYSSLEEARQYASDNILNSSGGLYEVDFLIEGVTVFPLKD